MKSQRNYFLSLLFNARNTKLLKLMSQPWKGVFPFIKSYLSAVQNLYVQKISYVSVSSLSINGFWLPLRNSIRIRGFNKTYVHKQMIIADVSHQFVFQTYRAIFQYFPLFFTQLKEVSIRPLAYHKEKKSLLLKLSHSPLDIRFQAGANLTYNGY